MNVQVRIPTVMQQKCCVFYVRTHANIRELKLFCTEVKPSESMCRTEQQSLKTFTYSSYCTRGPERKSANTSSAHRYVILDHFSGRPNIIFLSHWFNRVPFTYLSAQIG